MDANWDTATYARYTDERARPFYDLVRRVRGDPRRIVDLGCGTGRLTRTLQERWPDAEIHGVDASPQMLKDAHTDVPNLVFIQDDLVRYRPPWPVDLIVSNAALHWVPDHPRLLQTLVERLAPDGQLAVQVPTNHHAPSHRIVRETAAAPEWGDRFQGLGAVHVLAPEDYLRHLHAHGCSVDLWTTTYHHILEGAHAVRDWLEGTTLRPYLSRLDPGERAAFLKALDAPLRRAYPERDGHVVFPFTRLFFVARRGASIDTL